MKRAGHEKGWPSKGRPADVPPATPKVVLPDRSQALVSDEPATRVSSTSLLGGVVVTGPAGTVAFSASGTRAWAPTGCVVSPAGTSGTFSTGTVSTGTVS